MLWIIFCHFLFSVNAWSKAADTNFVLADQINQGFAREDFKKQLVGPSASSPLTSLAINYLKSKNGSLLAYPRGEYFCYQYFYVRECFRSVGNKQIQFLGSQKKFRLIFNPKAADLSEAVKLEPMDSIAHLSLDFLPKAQAQGDSAKALEIDLAIQFQQLQTVVARRTEHCLGRASRRSDATECVMTGRKDVADLAKATETVVNKELQRIRASVMIYTQSGWTNLKFESLSTFLNFATKHHEITEYTCGAPLSFGKFSIESTGEERVYKVKTEDGGTYVTAFVSSADLDLNKCQLKAKNRWPWESCLSENAIDKQPRPFYDSCRLLEYACKTQQPPDIVYVGQCDSPKCESLKPLRSNVQNKVALANRAGFQGDLNDSIRQIQEAMLIAEGLDQCCGDVKCRQHLAEWRKVRLRPPEKDPDSVPRPDGKDAGVKESDI